MSHWYLSMKIILDERNILFSLGLHCHIRCPNPSYFIRLLQCYLAPCSMVLVFWNITNMTKNAMSFICYFSHIITQFSITQLSSRSSFFLKKYWTNNLKNWTVALNINLPAMQSRQHHFNSPSLCFPICKYWGLNWTR